MGDEHGAPLVKVTDVLGISASAKALAEGIIAGVGQFLKPWQSRRLNRADLANATDWLELAEQHGASLIELSATLEGRAQIRASAEQARFQNNREAVASFAVDEFKSVPKDELASSQSEQDTDWLDAFWNLAEKVTAEEMQRLWARVLVHKIARGMAYSPRLLNFISLMDRTEIAAIENVSPFVASAQLNATREHFIVTTWSDKAGNISEEAKPFRELNLRMLNLMGNRASELLGPIGFYVESGWAFSVAYPKPKQYLSILNFLIAL